jgi:hypothetical protein
LHPAIIDEHTFRKVQRRFKVKVKHQVHNFTKIDEELPLRVI